MVKKRKAKEKMDGWTVLEKGVNDDAMTATRGEWKKMTCCADPKQHRIKAGR